VGSEFETRRNDKMYFTQLLRAQHYSKTPSDFNEVLMWIRAAMEPEDVKLVLQEFEEWKNSL
jgi:hypothetical protein